MTTVVGVENRGESVLRQEQVMIVGENDRGAASDEGQVESAVEPWKASMRGSCGNDIRKNNYGSQRKNTKLNHKSDFQKNSAFKLRSYNENSIK